MLNDVPGGLVLFLSIEPKCSLPLILAGLVLARLRDEFRRGHYPSRVQSVRWVWSWFCPEIKSLSPAAVSGGFSPAFLMQPITDHLQCRYQPVVRRAFGLLDG